MQLADSPASDNKECGSEQASFQGLLQDTSRKELKGGLHILSPLEGKEAGEEAHVQG